MLVLVGEGEPDYAGGPALLHPEPHLGGEEPGPRSSCPQRAGAARPKLKWASSGIRYFWQKL